ncbi:unnamed protein product [Amoebophrya sp. A25]|nr:unnamed protein product [Amoebophrya sp. A25]|eukprot:GSA25T00008913001.1
MGGGRNKKGKGKGKGRKQAQHARVMTPGVLITATQPSMLAKAAGEALDMLNAQTDSMFNGNTCTTRKRVQDEDDGSSSSPAAKRQRGSGDDGDCRGDDSFGGGLSGDLAAELAAEVDEIKVHRKKQQTKGWRFQMNFDTIAKGVAFLHAPEYDVPREQRTELQEQREQLAAAAAAAAASTSNAAQQVTSACSTSGGDESRPDGSTKAPEKVVGESSVDVKVPQNNAAAAEAEEQEHLPPHILQKRREAARKHRIRRLPWNRPSTVAEVIFSATTEGSKYVIRMTPIDHVCTPHLSNFEDLLRKVLPETFGSDEIKEAYGGKKDEAAVQKTQNEEQAKSGSSSRAAGEENKEARSSSSIAAVEGSTGPENKESSSASGAVSAAATTSSVWQNKTWSLDFRRHHCNKLSKEDCLDLLKKHMPSSMRVDVSEPDFLVVVEITPTFLGFSLLEDVKTRFRGDFRLFKEPQEQGDEEEGDDAVDNVESNYDSSDENVLADDADIAAKQEEACKEETADSNVMADSNSSGRPADE